MAACVPPFVGLLSIALLPTDESYKWTKWGMYLIAVTFIIPTFMGWQMIPSNVAGKTKRTVCSSINFIAYCVGKWSFRSTTISHSKLIEFNLNRKHHW